MSGRLRPRATRRTKPAFTHDGTDPVIQREGVAVRHSSDFEHFGRQADDYYGRLASARTGEQVLWRRARPFNRTDQHRRALDNTADT